MDSTFVKNGEDKTDEVGVHEVGNSKCVGGVGLGLEQHLSTPSMVPMIAEVSMAEADSIETGGLTAENNNDVCGAKPTAEQRLSTPSMFSMDGDASGSTTEAVGRDEIGELTVENRKGNCGDEIDVEQHLSAPFMVSITGGGDGSNTNDNESDETQVLTVENSEDVSEDEDLSYPDIPQFSCFSMTRVFYKARRKWESYLEMRNAWLESLTASASAAKLKRMDMLAKLKRKAMLAKRERKAMLARDADGRDRDQILKEDDDNDEEEDEDEDEEDEEEKEKETRKKIGASIRQEYVPPPVKTHSVEFFYRNLRIVMRPVFAVVPEWSFLCERTRGLEIRISDLKARLQIPRADVQSAAHHIPEYVGVRIQQKTWDRARGCHIDALKNWVGRLDKTASDARARREGTPSPLLSSRTRFPLELRKENVPLKVRREKMEEYGYKTNC